MGEATVVETEARIGGVVERPAVAVERQCAVVAELLSVVARLLSSECVDDAAVCAVAAVASLEARLDLVEVFLSEAVDKFFL